MIPVVGDLVQGGLGHQRCTGTHVAPLVILQVLDPALQLLDHLGSLGQEQGQPLADHIYGGEQTHLTPQAVVVSVLDICQERETLLQVCLLGVGSAVDTCQHLVMLIASPVSTGARGELECLDGLGAHQVRSSTKLDEIALLVEGDGLILRQVLDHLDLIRLLPALHQRDSLFSGESVVFQFVPLLDDLLHFLLDLVQVLSVQWTQIEIVVETVLDGRSDGQLGLWEQVLHRLRQHVGAGVAIGLLAVVVLEGQDVYRSILIDNRSQVYIFSVYLADAGHAGKPVAQVSGNVDDRHGLVILFLTAVFQCDDHVWLFLLLLIILRRKRGKLHPRSASGNSRGWPTIDSVIASLYRIGLGQAKNPFRQICCQKGRILSCMRGSTHLPEPIDSDSHSACNAATRA